jgi:hypothetical protein
MSEVEAGGSLGVPGQSGLHSALGWPGLHSETIICKRKQQKTQTTSKINELQNTMDKKRFVLCFMLASKAEFSTHWSIVEVG